ncbi:MAG: hypothetical protein Kow0069_22150 [Promethearchaeota archaeon]
MPKEIKTEDDFLRISRVAEQCRVKRVKDTVKLKLRTARYLYTYKTDPDRAKALVEQVDCEIIEL